MEVLKVNIAIAITASANMVSVLKAVIMEVIAIENMLMEMYINTNCGYKCERE